MTERSSPDSAEIERLIEDLLQASVDYERAERFEAKHRRQDLEDAKVAIRTALQQASVKNDVAQAAGVDRAAVAEAHEHLKKGMSRLGVVPAELHYAAHALHHALNDNAPVNPVSPQTANRPRGKCKCPYDGCDPCEHCAAQPQAAQRPFKSVLQDIANRAREYGNNYRHGSDPRNTFDMLAEWIESLSRPQRPEGK